MSPPYETNKPISVIVFDINGDPVDLDNVNVSNFPDHSIIDSGNSTNTPLAASGVFVGEAIDTGSFISAEITVFTDQASLQDGLELQTSDDGNNWFHEHFYTMPVMTPGRGECLQFTLSGQYFRVVYRNGPVAQGSFRLQTKLTRASTSPHFHQIDYPLSDTHPAQIVRAILTAKRPDQVYVNINSTSGGNLKVSVEELDENSNVATESNQQLIIDELVTLNATDFSTETTLLSILNKLIAAPATEAKQDAAIALLSSIDGKDFATQTTLAAILAKIIAAPSTETKQDSMITQLTNLNAKDFATQTTLAAILAKIIASPATEAKQDDIIAAINAISGDDPPLTAEAPGSATVGVTSASALAANADRKGLIVTNLSDGLVSLAFGSTAVLGSGISLAPYGGTYSMGRFDKSTAQMNAIAENALSQISIQEYS